jgi:ElaB/YqjD/DUF883 family membrane-anchored ribosome-binding protein
MTNTRGDYSHDGTADRLRDMADTTTDRFKNAGEKAQETASSMAEQARRYGEKAQNAVRQFKPFVERSLKEQPVATLAGAAAIGFLLGALWKR